MKKKWWIIIVVVVLVLAVAGFNGQENDPAPSEPTQTMQSGTSEPSKEPDAKPEKKGYAVGEVGSLKNVEVSLVSVTESEGSDFFGPRKAMYSCFASLISQTIPRKS